MKYPKSWCKPIDEEKVPPDNFGHFKFAEDNIDRALSEPLSGQEQKMLSDRLESVKDRPFFEV